ncbi:MAG: uracil-DNA glycosylase [Burkholderiales bacterium]
MKLNLGCRDCPRLAAHLDSVRESFPEYHARPVPAFGDEEPNLLIVGLAPGLHGANRTGRPFTGDHAGILLYSTLHRFGFASRPESAASNDGLILHRCRITNAVKCLPPKNKPLPSEVRNCNGYLRAELAVLAQGSVTLTLGATAHRAVLMALDLRVRNFPFAHGAVYSLPRGLTLKASYHCSRYNTQTKRLTTEMFAQVFQSIVAQLCRT